MPEISDAELAILRGAGALLNEIYANPEHGKAVKRAIKTVRPDVVIPELEADAVLAPVRGELGELKGAVEGVSKRFDEYLTTQQQREAERDLAGQMATAASKHKLTDEGRAGMLELMQKEGIVNPDIAAELYVNRMPRATPANQRMGSAYGAGSYADITGMQGDKEREELLINDPDRFLVETVTEIMNDPAFADS